MTLTLNRHWSNIRNAHRFIILDICAELFKNPTRGSKDIERTQNTVIQCLTLNYDFDLKPTLGQTYVLHLDVSYLTFVQLFENPTNRQTNGRADRQMDGRTELKQYVSLFYGGRHNK